MRVKDFRIIILQGFGGTDLRFWGWRRRMHREYLAQGHTIRIRGVSIPMQAPSPVAFTLAEHWKRPGEFIKPQVPGLTPRELDFLGLRLAWPSWFLKLPPSLFLHAARVESGCFTPFLEWNELLSLGNPVALCGRSYSSPSPSSTETHHSKCGS